MTLDGAIINLKADLLKPGSVDKVDFQHAEQLGIEALKGILKVRRTLEPYVTALLPGETEENIVGGKR